jgi:hypothetical protein
LKNWLSEHPSDKRTISDCRFTFSCRSNGVVDCLAFTSPFLPGEMVGAKMRAYTDVIQALHHMKRDLEICIEAEKRGQDTDTDFHKEWGAKHRAAWDEIRKQIDVGEFLYSPDSMQILQTLNLETTAPYETYFDHLEAFQTAVEKCLPAIKAAARKDLGLPPIRRL